MNFFYQFWSFVYFQCWPSDITHSKFNNKIIYPLGLHVVIVLSWLPLLGLHSFTSGVLLSGAPMPLVVDHWGYQLMGLKAYNPLNGLGNHWLGNCCLLGIKCDKIIQIIHTYEWLSLVSSSMHCHQAFIHYLNRFWDIYGFNNSLDGRKLSEPQTPSWVCQGTVSLKIMTT